MRISGPLNFRKYEGQLENVGGQNGKLGIEIYKFWGEGRSGISVAL